VIEKKSNEILCSTLHPSDSSL